MSRGRKDRGFLAVDRRLTSDTIARLGPELAGVLLLMEVEFGDHGEFVGSVKDLAVEWATSPKTLRRWLDALAVAGAIEHVKATNATNGSIRLVGSVARPLAAKPADAPSPNGNADDAAVPAPSPRRPLAVPAPFPNGHGNAGETRPTTNKEQGTTNLSTTTTTNSTQEAPVEHGQQVVVVVEDDRAVALQEQAQQRAVDLVVNAKLARGEAIGDEDRYRATVAAKVRTRLALLTGDDLATLDVDTLAHKLAGVHAEKPKWKRSPGMAGLDALRDFTKPRGWEGLDELSRRAKEAEQSGENWRPAMLGRPARTDVIDTTAADGTGS